VGCVTRKEGRNDSGIVNGGIVNDIPITHDRQGPLYTFYEAVLASKSSLDGLWPLGGCGQKKGTRAAQSARRSGSDGIPKAPKQIGT